MTRWGQALALLTLAAPLWAASQQSPLTFEKNKVGSAPPDIEWVGLRTTAKAVWTITTDGSAPSRDHVLTHKGEGNADGFDCGLLSSTADRDGDLSFFFRSAGERLAAGAGAVWRYEAPGTYYLFFISSLDDHLVLVRSKNGRERVIDKADHIVMPERWHQLRILFADATYSVYLDSDLIMGGKDKGILSPGRAGFCTRTGALTSFDNLSLSPTAVVEPAGR